MRGGGDRAGSSQFQGVSCCKRKSNWQAKCKGKRLGYHTTEEGAAHVYSTYLKDGVVPKPAERRAWCASQIKGVSWDKKSNKWRAACKGTKLGHHATEEEAVRAYSKYLNDGINPVKHREAFTSQYKGVYCDKHGNKWKAECKQTLLGNHTTEEAAGRAYNIEAARLGVALNVIPPVGAAGVGAGAGAGPGAGAGGGAGPKRAAPKTPASPSTSKKIKRAAPGTLAVSAPCKKMKL
jgi:hypothetical protein